MEVLVMGTGKNKKKYSEINMSEILFGDSMTVFEHVEDDRHITLFMKSKAVQGTCPVCGVVSDQYHSTYHRNLQAVPIRGKNTRLDVIAYKFYCNNPECSQKVFMESLPFDSFRISPHLKKVSCDVCGRCGKAFRTAYPEQE